jgi:diaminohydroxyphosphoribosylaminopyrimidine deaminase/5-amino-6-(5-phosphoribosylamino)uracil reductase
LSGTGGAGANVNDDEKYIARAVELAARAAGRTFPNPLVGAVMVSRGEVVGEGYHERAGMPHAEVGAIARAGGRAKGATLYLNLEPCCHYGKTPPCTDAILRAGISRVVFGIHDPDVKVRGRGAALLREGGVEVKAGVLAAESLELNMPYVHWKLTGRPFIALKLALTLDGRLAAAGRRWVTGERSRGYVHRLRAAMEAVAVGSGTLGADDPELDRRLFDDSLPPPARIVLDSRLSFPESHRWLGGGARVLLFCAAGADPGKRKRLEERGAEVCELPRAAGGVDLDSWVDALAGLGISSVLVEGGGRLAASMMRSGTPDRLVLFRAPFFGGPGAPGWYDDAAQPPWLVDGALSLTRCEGVGDDSLAVYDRGHLLAYGEKLALMGRTGGE